MAKDFRASQIETTKLIASGGLSGNGLRAGNTLGLAIYSGSKASNRAGGISDSTMFTNVGNDVYLFISGTQSDPTKGAHSETSDAVVLFGGDVVIRLCGSSRASFACAIRCQVIGNNRVYDGTQAIHVHRNSVVSSVSSGPGHIVNLGNGASHRSNCQRLALNVGVSEKREMPR